MIGRVLITLFCVVMKATVILLLLMTTPTEERLFDCAVPVLRYPTPLRLAYRGWLAGALLIPDYWRLTRWPAI